MSYYQKIHLFLIASLTLELNTPAIAKTCDFETNSKPVSVIFKIDYGTPKYEAIDKKELAKKTANSHVLGLTEAHFGMSYEMKVRGENECLFLDTLTVHYGYPTLNIFITNEYEKGSCEYNEILIHENKHVFIHQDTLRSHSEKFGKAIQEIAQTIPAEPFERGATNVDEQMNKMILSLKNHPRLAVLEKSFNQKREDANQELDRKESYLESQKKCLHW